MRANISIEGLSGQELLKDWAWLLQKPYTLIAMNNFGDMFLQDEDGEVHLLVLGMGEIIRVAGSVAEFRRLASEKETQREWFALGLLTELERARMTISDGQCFGFKTPPILGGTVELSNIEISHIGVYISLMGQICQQIKKLPAGTKITGFTIA